MSKEDITTALADTMINGIDITVKTTGQNMTGAVGLHGVTANV